MAEAKKSSQTGASLRRRHKVNPKHGVRPRVLANANQWVTRSAIAVIVAFLAIIALHALLG